MSDPTPYPEPRALTPRKRVVAREVTEVETSNRDSAALVPDLISPGAPAPVAPADPVVVVDPTTLGRRHRRSSHQRIYRWTQACSIIAGLAGIVALFCAIAEDLVLARWVAAPGVALGLLATYLSGRTSLSARWRGWAIASAVFGAVILIMTWVQPAIMGDDHTDLRQRAPAKAPANAPSDPRQP
jgi:hypothetical protein